jgi:hypothetical protein
MISKIINNPFGLILVAILLVAGIFWASLLIQTEGVITLERTTNNPNFNTLDSKIDSFDSKKWQSTEYHLLYNRITLTKKKNLIDKDLEILLLKSLNGSYSSQIIKATDLFCRNEKGENRLIKLEKELDFLIKEPLAIRLKDNSPLKDAKKKLKTYRAAKRVPWAIKAYATIKEYNKNTSDQFTKRIERYESDPLLSKNPALIGGYKEGRKYLGRINGMEVLFNSCNKNCDCQIEFGKNEFYLSKCNEIQK